MEHKRGATYISITEVLDIFYQKPDYNQHSESDNTVIFWTEFRCWRKSNSNKAMWLQCWSDRFNISTLIITNWLIVARYQRIFSFICIFFFPLLPPRLLPVCWWVCLTRNLSFPCCVFFFVLCAFAMCPVPNIASVPGLSILQCHFGFR